MNHGGGRYNCILGALGTKQLREHLARKEGHAALWSLSLQSLLAALNSQTAPQGYRPKNPT